MNKTVKFYWDIGSTNTYFAFHLLRPLAQKYGVEIDYIPFNLGYVFRHHGYALAHEPKAKMKNRKVDLMRWAKRHDLAFQVPKEFPIKTSRILRGSLVMKAQGLHDAYMEQIFHKYWELGDASIQHYASLAGIAGELGVDPQMFTECCESQDIREEIIKLTDKALAEGVFGAPTMVVDEEIYWGKVRFEFIEDHLKSG